LKRVLNKKNVKEQLILYALLAPVLIYVFIFNYIPIYGLVIAFQNYFPGSRFLSLGPATQWVGIKHFIDFMTSVYFWRLIRNTLVLSGLLLSIGFVIPILFALFLNEIKSIRYRKILQTTSYLPYFISMVVVASMSLTLIGQNGLVNKIITAMGFAPIGFNTDPRAFPWVYVITTIWKTFGWSSVIYMAAISGIDPNLYEAANIDGASRFAQMWHITLASIKGTIIILLIFTIGGLLNSNTEFILLMYNPGIYETSDVIGTYIYRVGLQGGQFSKTTAIGMFMQVINFSLLVGANAISRKVNNYSLW
jgi:putative aldouronate transport system permease protein